MWSVGNEVDLFYKNLKFGMLWKTIKMIKELDPNPSNDSYSWN